MTLCTVVGFHIYMADPSKHIWPYSTPNSGPMPWVTLLI